MYLVKIGVFFFVLRNKKFNMKGIESWLYGRRDISRVKIVI